MCGLQALFSRATPITLFDRKDIARRGYAAPWQRVHYTKGNVTLDNIVNGRVIQDHATHTVTEVNHALS